MKWWNETVELFRKRDPAIKSNFEIFLYPTLYAVGMYRVAHWLYIREWYFIARFISQLARFLTGIEIHPKCVIGKRFFADHGGNIVIGSSCIIGDDVMMYHNVTLGGNGNDKTEKRHPTIGNNVMISTGSIIIGNVYIGDNSKVGAGAIIIENIPANHTVVGTPSTRRLIPHKK